VLVALAACTADDAPPPTDCPTTGRYLALTPGATWQYRVTDANGVIEKAGLNEIRRRPGVLW
jgi:hypothetical protein